MSLGNQKLDWGLWKTVSKVRGRISMPRQGAAAALHTTATPEQLTQAHPKFETSLRCSVKAHLKNKSMKVCLQRTGWPTLINTDQHSPEHQLQFKPLKSWCFWLRKMAWPQEYTHRASHPQAVMGVRIPRLWGRVLAMADCSALTMLPSLPKV